MFKLFNIVKAPNKKKYYFCGIKIWSKKNVCAAALQAMAEQIINRVSANVQRALNIAFLHQKTFGEYRNCYAGKTVVLVGAGPTLNQFEPIKNAVYVGLNRAFKYDKVHFDYLFTIDKRGLDIIEENYQEDFLKYDCIKFVGDQNLGKDYQIPQSFGNGIPSVRRYKTTANYMAEEFCVDIDTAALVNSTSCSIQAMQFILFTNPKKIYVTGVDCTASLKEHFIGGSFDNATRNEDVCACDAWHINGWKSLKLFIETYYPETEIFMVNPVRLKGLFKDVYTHAYLEKHPELNDSDVAILETVND